MSREGSSSAGMLPIGNIPALEEFVKIVKMPVSCINRNIFADIEVNDLLENIRLLMYYIRRRNKKKYMPHASVKTIRDLIYWEYAKLIAGSAVGDRKNYGFVMHTYKKLKDEHIKPSQILRENKMFVESDNVCAYCDSLENLEWEHIIPKKKIDLDTIDNMVKACKKCNLEKSGRDPFEWYKKEKQYEVPRIVLGKYLKLIYGLHEKRGTLDSTDLNNDGKLDIYDLGVIGDI